MLREGDNAPEFTAPDQNANQVNLANLRGEKVVLYFYPKDSTPGCTKEACSFRDNFSTLTEKGIKVFGISTDNAVSHRKFIAEYDLPLTLLTDAGHKVADAYGSYGVKKFMGKTYSGFLRKTFLIDETGKIKKIFDRVKVEEHAAEVLKAFEE